MIRRLSHKPLRQLQSVLAQVRPEDYCAPAALLDGATMGRHCRHILEFYTCLLKSVETGRLCYDDRERDILLEENTGTALRTIDQIIADLNLLPSEKRLELITRQMEMEIRIATTLERELVFVAEHAVHHLAMIRMLVSGMYPYIVIDETLGYSDATLQYMQQQNVAG